MSAHDIPVEGSTHRKAMMLLLDVALETPRRKNKYATHARISWKLVEQIRAHLRDEHGLDADDILREAERRTRTAKAK